jgi:hypothetical protein
MYACFEATNSPLLKSVLSPKTPLTSSLVSGWMMTSSWSIQERVCDTLGYQGQSFPALCEIVL